MKAASLLLICAAALAECPLGASAPVARLPAVKVRALEKASAAAASRSSATVAPGTRVDLAFRLGGYVDEIAQVKQGSGTRELQEGDRVTKGTVLARLRQQDYEQKISEARAGVSEATAARAQAERDAERAQKLFKSGAISRAELDQTKSKALTARARVQGAMAKVSEAQTALGDATLVSPIDGVVLKRNLDKGALVGAGVPVWSIADTTKVKVVFGVADSELDKLKLNAPQSITTEAFHGRAFAGKVTRIGTAADAKMHLFEVEVTLPNEADELKPGMVAALVLPSTATRADAPMVPLSAVQKSKVSADGFTVFVVAGPDADAVVRTREIELGDFLGALIPVTSGLKEGERVVVMGASQLSDGAKVRVIP
jgi:multidrug efflux system membrane fusion protein